MNNQSKISEGLGKIRDMDPNTALLYITVGEFLELQNKKNAEKKYEYGLKGIAKIFGCSVSQANRIKGLELLMNRLFKMGISSLLKPKKHCSFSGKKEKNDKK
ncbi:DUF3853 family protein [Elizabethkingia ursingii]